MNLLERTPIILGQTTDTVLDMEFMLSHYGSATLTKQFVIVEQATSNGILDGSDSDDSRVTLDILKHFLKGCTTNQLNLLTLEVFMRSNVME